MLLEFSVGNFLSFKDRVTISMEAAGISEFPENTFQQERYRLLKTAVVYGANASGKSNLMRAMSTMRYLVRSSAQRSSADGFEVTPFLLSTETEKQPCFFEVLFLLESVRYRYGFEVLGKEVRSEWLFQAKAQVENCLFIREGELIEVGKKFPEGENLEEKTRANALFLSVADQFNGPLAKRIMAWFANWNTISGSIHEEYRTITRDLFREGAKREALLEFIRELDLGFRHLEIREEENEVDVYRKYPGMVSFVKEPQAIYGSKEDRVNFNTRHDVFDPEGKKAGEQVFDMKSQESAGTNKLFDLLGPIFYTLQKGSVLVVDELDSKLHPLLTKTLLGLFHSRESNRLNAQLVFATHDTNLLSYGDFRRDQVYFVEKDRSGATDLYSLLEYKEDGQTVRKDRSFEKDYIQGRYGAIPYFGDFSKFMDRWEKEVVSPGM